MQYTANGEASDWMLSEHGVYAMSPEIGSSNHNSDVFFISKAENIRITMEQNFVWIEYIMLKLQPQL